MDSKIKDQVPLLFFTVFDIEGGAVGKEWPEDPLRALQVDKVPVSLHCRRRSTEDREQGTYYVDT